MYLLTFKSDDDLRLGVRTAQGVIDVKAAAEALGAADVPASPAAFFADGLALLPALRTLVMEARQRAAGAAWLLDEAALTYGPAVPNPGKILCVGLNYRAHAAETNARLPETPVLFSKFNNTVAASGESIPLPPNAVQYDYEAELVVVMGRQARSVAEDEALRTVLGYCNGNDLSARDLQFRTNQWLLGKTLDRFLPLGPYLVTADEAGDPQAMPIRCWLNGELRQDSTTADMIFSVAHIISYASQYLTLEAGDIISTGTPSGVILGRTEKVWMKPGDEVTVEVGPLGRLTNVMSGG